MSYNLTQASSQWQTRPADERFWTLEELEKVTLEHRAKSRKRPVRLSTLEVEPFSWGGETPNGLSLKGRNGTDAFLTHHAFTDLCRYAQAPASYLRTLPTELVAKNLNTGLRRISDEPREDEALDRVLLARVAPNVSTRKFIEVQAIASKKYARIWNSDVASELIKVRDKGWKVPPGRASFNTCLRSRPATEEDLLKGGGGFLSVKVGDMIAPSGIYASDHDLFVFMVNEDCTIEIGGVPYSRGFFVMNAEVPGMAFQLVTFLYNHVCGNHIVWDAKRVQSKRVIHIGTKASIDAQSHLAWLKTYQDQSPSIEMDCVGQALDRKLGHTKDEVVKLLSTRNIGSQSQIELAYALADEHPEDGHKGANTQWGMVQGLTRLSQENSYTDERVKLDRSAGKLLSMEF